MEVILLFAFFFPYVFVSLFLSLSSFGYLSIFVNPYYLLCWIIIYNFWKIFSHCSKYVFFPPFFCWLQLHICKATWSCPTDHCSLHFSNFFLCFLLDNFYCYIFRSLMFSAAIPNWPSIISDIVIFISGNLVWIIFYTFTSFFFFFYTFTSFNQNIEYIKYI